MDGIVQPIVTSRTPRIGPPGVMCATRTDLTDLAAAMNFEGHHHRTLYSSRLYFRKDGFFLTGSVTGAPYAAMMLETLAAWGARQIVFLGWCGAVSADAAIGDVIVPDLAWIDEGTSGAYLPGAASRPSPPLTRRMTDLLAKDGIPHREGAIWTTDAIFRETPEKVTAFRNKGALAVEMEVSALFTVAAFRNIEAAAVLIVSDDLSGLTWQPGFKDKRFIETRQQLIHTLADHFGRTEDGRRRTEDRGQRTADGGQITVCG